MLESLTVKKKDNFNHAIMLHNVTYLKQNFIEKPQKGENARMDTITKDESWVKKLVTYLT